MESQNLVKSFKYNSPQQPMFSVIESPLRYRSFPQNINPTVPFKEISFPSYIQPKDPKILSSSGCTINDDTEISIFDAHKYFSENSTDDTKDNIKKPQQQQIPPSHDHMLSIPRLSSVSSADGYGRNYRTRSFQATPTASSEASWNSQTGLLANPPGSMAVSLRDLPSHDMRSKKTNPAAKKWSFCRKCCCTGKNSVMVKEATSDSDIRGPAVIHNEMSNLEKTSYSYAKRGQSRDEEAPANMPQKISIPNVEMALQQKATAPNYPLQLSPGEKISPANPPCQQRVSPSGRPFGDANVSAFTFPILNSSIQATKPAGFKAMITKSVINPGLEDPPRDSLEVFQPLHDPMSISRTPDFNPGSPMARLSNMDDDMYSDASSDLFEIESFSTQSNSYQMYRGRDSLDDEAPAFNPRRFASASGMISSNKNNLHGRSSIDEPSETECYAPSEVSIDWSVTTAEGFDRASVTNFSISASEIGNVAFLHKRLQEEASGGDGGKRKGNGLLLMSCRQEKSVSVGPQPVKCSVPEGPPILFPLGISGTGAGHVGGRPPRANNKLPLGSSHSARLSLAFAAS